MIYQTDFEEKKILKDGSTNYPDFMIRDFGCYVMSLFYLSTEGFKRFNPSDKFKKTREFFKHSFNRGWIDFDGYVKDPMAILQTRYVTKIKVKDFQKDKYIFIIGRYRLDSMPENLKSHFVVLDQDLEVIYDPVEKGSKHVKEGTLIDLRVFW